MKALVVGGAGFLGSHLVDRLLADGHAVDVVDDLSTGSLANLAEARASGGALKFHHLDAASEEAATLVGMRVPDVLYHVAAVPRGAPAAVASAFATTVGLLDAAAAHRVPKVVVPLPATVMYGRPASRDLPLKELPIEPRGLRGILARATVDALVQYRETEAVEFTVLAVGTVYGARQRAEAGVVAALRVAADADEPPTITGDGRQTRDFVFIDDVADALVRAGARGSGLVINIGTGEQTTIRELWAAIAGADAPPPRFVPSPPDELVRFGLSPVRARIHLAWSPWTSLSEGLAALG